MDKEDAVAQVFFIRNGKLIGREHYYLRIGEEEQKSEVLLTFMKQFYSGTPFIPREIMISEEIAEQELMEEYKQQTGPEGPHPRAEKGQQGKNGGTGRAERTDRSRSGPRADQAGRGSDGWCRKRDRQMAEPAVDRPHRGVRYLQYQRFPVGRLDDRLRERKAKAQ